MDEDYRKALGLALGSFWFLYLMDNHTPKIWNGKPETKDRNVRQSQNMNINFWLAQQRYCLTTNA